MKYKAKYAKWLNNIATSQPTVPALQIGIVYWGDTGNGNFVCGLLLSYEDGWAIIKDARGKEHRVIESTLKSAQ